MNAEALISKLRNHDIQLLACGECLIVNAPRGALSMELRGELRVHKPELLATLSRSTSQPSPAGSELIEYAAGVLPTVRFTIRETGDVERDFDLLHRLRWLIHEHQPGGNRVLLTIITPDRRKVVVEWRAVAARSLRLGIATVLANVSRADDAR